MATDPVNLVGDRDGFIEALLQRALESYQGDEQEALAEFIRLFLTRYSLEDLAGREWSELTCWVLDLWQYTRKAQTLPFIHIANPTEGENRWGCPHTVLLLLQQDMPFLVDSVRIELTGRNIPIYSIRSVPHVLAGTGERVLGVRSAMSQSDDARALIYVELARIDDAELLGDIVRGIGDVLEQVARAVRDYKPMRECAAVLAAQLAHIEGYPEYQSVDETRTFLGWLNQDHFTFLGYSEFNLTERDGAQVLVENRSKRLGLFDNGSRTRTKKIGASGGVARFYLSPMVAAFSKSPERARVHRNAYPDYVVVKRFNTQGELVGEARLLGLYTSAVYSISPARIPLVRKKVEDLYERIGLNMQSHEGKALAQLVETFPRDELFQAGSAELHEIIGGILSINERYQIRIFLRTDRFDKFFSALVYIPRDIFSSEVREKIQHYLADELGAVDQEFTTWFSESMLARVHLVFRVKSKASQQDISQLEKNVAELIRPWRDGLLDRLQTSRGDIEGRRLYNLYRETFPSAYQSFYSAAEAIGDIYRLETLQAGIPGVEFLAGDPQILQLKLLSLGQCIELSDIIPILENMGLRVVAEHPFELVLRDKTTVWLHDFRLRYQAPHQIDKVSLGRLRDALLACWEGRVARDAFNRLVLFAGLDWRQVEILRTYAFYMRQIGFPFTVEFIAEVLCKADTLTCRLVKLFETRFDPNQNASDRAAREGGYETEIMAGLEAVDNLSDDRILRQYLALIKATVRCNYFKAYQGEGSAEYLCVKLMPRELPGVPEPRPLFEIFVNSVRFEGVHLRGAKVARGGLRWSDRLQDYRTEVLGLVKAQQVKNAVIVPGGAKGGFVCKQLAGLDRNAQHQEGVACYRGFISALLDLTDNLQDGKVLGPQAVVRHDESDPYLVVAADKGTASFSDIANGIAQEYSFWLGDAFASGGSQGYDHKAMGITARGAWVSVQRHFLELGTDIQTTPFTVLGIGDMGGDVFGNGMLLSPAIKLVAAFNHLHIFIDPDPDCVASFAERKRLFTADARGWDAYDSALISAGGGVFSRSAKAIVITPEMQALLAIDESRLTPSELIHQLLKAPLDLIWNGGIGTYVKASTESHADAGDKANDSLRVDGKDLRARVLGEGGNLGVTQKGRIEYALAGGACNTDFIDNAAGVDCSDHEVNIKILLKTVMEQQGLSARDRNLLLAEMTDAVARSVLENNHQQTRAISLARISRTSAAEYRRLMNEFEAAGKLDRRLEFLPDDETLAEREAGGAVLTRPEIAVLIAYAKVELKDALSISAITEDALLAEQLEPAFPKVLIERYPEALQTHSLRREIIATQIANNIVNTCGCTFAQRLRDATGADNLAIARAFVFAETVFSAEYLRHELDRLELTLGADTVLPLMHNISVRVTTGARWYLRNRRGSSDLSSEVKAFFSSMDEARQGFIAAVGDASRQQYQVHCDKLQALGVDESLALRLVHVGELYSGLNVTDIAQQLSEPLDRVIALYVALMEFLHLDKFVQQLMDAKADNYWQALARDSFRDDLESLLRQLTQTLLSKSAGAAVADVLQQWSDQHQGLVARWQAMVAIVQASPGGDYAMFAVALRELLDLAQTSEHRAGS